MSFAKGSALVLGIVAAVALGVWIGPHITDRGAAVTSATAPASQAPVVRADKNLPARAVHRAPASERADAASGKATTFHGSTPRTVSVIAPALHERLKPLLNRGADMNLASEDFGEAEQFAAVAHASRNTEIPFMVLKHRVVYENKSLESAIKEFKPGLNATEEARRARVEAKSDIQALES